MATSEMRRLATTLSKEDKERLNRIRADEEEIDRIREKARKGKGFTLEELAKAKKVKLKSGRTMRIGK